MLSCLLLKLPPPQQTHLRALSQLKESLKNLLLERGLQKMILLHLTMKLILLKMESWLVQEKKGRF